MHNILVRHLKPAAGKSQCNYPLTYKISSNWEVVKDSVNLHQTAPVAGSKEWVDQYEVIKIHKSQAVSPFFHDYE